MPLSLSTHHRARRCRFRRGRRRGIRTLPAVLRDLLQAAMMQTGADRGTVQLREPVYGGLTIEGDSGFDRSCLDFRLYR